MIFQTHTRIDLVTIPGTHYVALAQDKNLTPKAIKAGTIMLETEVADLPEVRALGPEDVVLDVGAFIGDTALIFAAGGALVHAFEAQADAYFAALWNTKHEEHVIMYHAAVGNGQRVAINQDPIGGNLGTRTVGEVILGRPAGTFAQRLDDMAANTWPTFIKIDVEGFEPAVIAGAHELLTNHKPTVLVEIYPELLARNGWTAADVTGPLEALGYRWREAIGNSSEPRWDIIAIHESKSKA
jgi:FkbM family methyltransferase